MDHNTKQSELLTLCRLLLSLLLISTGVVSGFTTTQNHRRHQFTFFHQHDGLSSTIATTNAQSLIHNRRISFSTPLYSSTIESTSSSTTQLQDEDDDLFEKDQPQYVLSRGDSRGAAALLEDVSVYRGSVSLLNNIDWRIEPLSKWALIGTNGCGKSTLLKAMMEELAYDGTVTIGTKQQVGYLQQTAVAGSSRSIMDEASLALPEMVKAKRTLQRIEDQLTALDDNPNNDQKEEETTLLLEAYDKAQNEMERVGAYQQEQQVSTMLHGLGFTNLTQPCDELSGGWQMRVSFAKTLLRQPTLCLMDEPGNHLDRSARQWLANYLAKYQGGAMILVTHDVELLQAMDHIAEVTPSGGLQLYKSCTYDQYLALKEQRQSSAMVEYEKNAAKAAKLQAFVDKFGASATKASAAQSRVKQLDKMKEQGLLDKPVEEKRFKPSLTLPEPPRSNGEILLELKSAHIGYTAGDDDDNNDATGTETISLVQDVNLEIRRGMKILVRGPNGSGKSTLLHSLRGTLSLLGGDRIENQLLKLGVFTQDLAQELDGSARAVDLVTAYARDGYDVNISDEAARGVLGGLGLTGDKALRKVQDLSGLAMFALKPSNLYLLDEVSNHLDIECVEALSEALSQWGEEEGAIVVISHDKNFCEKVGFTHVVTVDDSRLTMEQRQSSAKDWDASVATVQRSNSDNTSSVNDASQTTTPLETTAKPTTSSKKMDPKLRKKAYNAPKRIEKIEEWIETKEEQIAVLEEAMMTHGSDVGKLVDLSKEKEGLDAEVAKLMEEWEELEGLLAQLD